MDVWRQLNVEGKTSESNYLEIFPSPFVIWLMMVKINTNQEKEKC